MQSQIVKRTCDICNKDLVEIKDSTHAQDKIYDYFVVKTGHNDWGSDSIDSEQEGDMCPECISKYVQHFLKCSTGKYNTNYIRIRHANWLEDGTTDGGFCDCKYNQDMREEQYMLDQNRKYAEVFFPKGACAEYKDFLCAMVSIDAIVMSKEQIDIEADTFKEEYNNCNVRLVLEDEAKVKSFKLIMDTFLPKREYKITDTPADPTFEKWLNRDENP